MRIASTFFSLSIVLSAICFAEVSYAQDRIALVIGNSSYEHAAALPNPKNDAVAIGEALENVGFDVRVNIDLDQRGMQAALRDFGLKAETADVALVYFAGHGIQVASQNYLLPVDAKLKRERDLIYEATPLSIVTAEVAQARELGMVVLDSCRDNPLAANLRASLGPVRSKLIGLGMARVEDVPPETLIAFSTRFDQLAYDGTGDLSPFTTALVKHIQEPGLELDLFFRKVRDTVLDLTANRQEPRTTDALGAKPFYFTAPKSNQPPELGELKPLIVADDAGATDVEIGAPTDADDDPLSIEVMGLPTFGVMENAGQLLNFGDQLTIEELEGLEFRPAKGEIGEAGAFLFVVRDGQGGVTAGRVPIDVVRSNKVPVVTAQQDMVWPRIPLGIEAPTDPDGDPLSITVLTVPVVGDIKDGEITIGVGDSLSVEALTGLMLDPNAGVAGEFAYEVADDHGGVSTASVALRLPGPEGEKAYEQLLTAKADAASTPEETLPQTRNGSTVEEPEDTETVAPAPSENIEVASLETITASNIRNAPGAGAGWITAVPAGTQLRSLEKLEEENWYHIELLDGTAGYISGELVREVETDAGSEEERPADVAVVDEPPLKPASRPEAVDKPEIKVAAIDPTSTPSAAEEFTECDSCPTMVALPEGRFQMGSTDGDRSEQPVREVAIDRPIAIGKYEVTLAEWHACASAGFCRRIGDPESGDEKRPVQNVSWADAETFVAWLKRETGEVYRLPTEAEWEYAARGGEQTKFWWGDSFEEGRANCADCGGAWDRKRPSDIGVHGPNPFGLHDMHGGVSEWVADCWVANYSDAPENGAARSLSFCPQRVLRGGSWRSEADDITASSRFQYDAQVSYYTNGFRVARDLN